MDSNLALSLIDTATNTVVGTITVGDSSSRGWRLRQFCHLNLFRWLRRVVLSIPGRSTVGGGPIQGGTHQDFPISGAGTCGILAFRSRLFHECLGSPATDLWAI